MGYRLFENVNHRSNSFTNLEFFPSIYKEWHKTFQKYCILHLLYLGNKSANHAITCVFIYTMVEIMMSQILSIVSGYTMFMFCVLIHGCLRKTNH